MHIEITIISATREDIPTLAKMYLAAFGTELGEPWTIESCFKNLEEALEEDYSFTAWLDNEIVGCLFTTEMTFEKGTELFIDTIMVDEKHRGKGIGSQLFEFAENLAKEKQLVGVRLTSSPKMRSYNWYKKLGLKESGWVELVKFY